MGRIIDYIEENCDSIYSDIHIRESEYISVRNLGEIEFTKTKIDKEDIEEFIRHINLESKRNNEIKEHDFSFSIKGYRFRGNLFSFMGKKGISIRKIPKKICSFKELNIPIDIKQIGSLSSGIVFITGPTGSGKTTTLASIIQYINENMKKHIITLEDPIEYVFKNEKSIITQREVGSDTTSFSAAIKSSLRQDPDIIVIGEVRDAETMINAIQAAETGHLCFCTLHTVGAVASVERVLGMFSGEDKERIRYDMSVVLRAVLSQQLIKIEEQMIPVIEYMVSDKSASNMIKEGKTGQLQNHIHTGTDRGMISMDTFLLKLYFAGSISKDVVYEKCINHEYIRKYIGKKYI